MVFWLIQGQLAEIRGLKKTLITREGNELERSALRHFLEGPVGYRLHSLDVYSSMKAYKTGIDSFKD